MPMFCPMCGGPARFVDIQTETQTIKCRFCNAEYSAAQLLNETGRREEPRNRRKEIRLPQPKSIKISEDGLDLIITRKWPVSSGIGALFFGIVWTCISSFIFLIPAGEWDGGEAPPFWFGALFLGVGILVLVIGIYALVNSTTYRINRQRITLTHHPLPWPGKTLDLDGVEQLYVKQHISTSRSSSGGSSTTITYSLNKVMRDGRHVTIDSNMQPEAALFIEQEIERLLRLENLPVRGEYGKGGWGAF
ncbi:MAG: hypothetical protein SNJ54_02800 [Anaerolineae bacterium]